MSDSKRTYTGSTLDVTWDAKRCIHAAECLRRGGGAFDVDRKPWVLPDAADDEQVIAAVHACPSGALEVIRGGRPVDLDPGEATVRVSVDGPLEVTARVSIAGTELDGRMSRVTLCRCGQTANPPFCDNSHRESGFTDPGRIDGDDAPPPAADAVIAVAPSEGGPLLVSGAHAIKGEAGGCRAVDKSALCRCGLSSNRPFCDGSHARWSGRD